VRGRLEAAQEHLGEAFDILNDVGFDREAKTVDRAMTLCEELSDRLHCL
jgi:hypothetical protein